jgi:hypothetical protein
VGNKTGSDEVLTQRLPIGAQAQYFSVSQFDLQGAHYNLTSNLATMASNHYVFNNFTDARGNFQGRSICLLCRGNHEYEDSVTP